VSAPPAAFSGAQVRVLLRAHLAEALRPGRNAEGIETRPLRQILLPMAMLGAWLAFGARAESAPSLLRALFLSAGVVVTLAVLPDPAEAYARRRDVLGHLPVGRASASVARLVFLLALLALLLVPFALPSLALLAWRGEAGGARIAGVLGGLLTLALAGIGLWLTVAFALARRFGVEGVRKAASVALSVAMVAVVLVGSASLLVGEALPLAGAAELLPVLPSSWFVNWLLPDAGARAALEAAGAALIAALAVALLLGMRPESVYEQGRSAAAERAGLAERLADGLDRRFGARRASAPLALLVVRVAAREPLLRLRARALLVTLVGVWALTLLADRAPITLPFVAVFGLFAVSGGALDLANSADAEAAWAISVAPIEAGDRVAALRLAALVRSALLPALLVAALAGRELGAVGAAVFGATFLAVALWLASLVVALRPREPLATPASVSGGSASLWLGTPLAFAGGAALGPAWGFLALPVPFALAAALIYGLSLAAFAQGLAAWGAARLRAAEARR